MVHLPARRFDIRIAGDGFEVVCDGSRLAEAAYEPAAQAMARVLAAEAWRAGERAAVRVVSPDGGARLVISFG